MERLSCTSTVRYNATEAAIHMARYQLAAPYCKGKRVLDVACGEGYGAYALHALGASSVEAVDNSPQAIANAKALFAARGIAFHLHDAESVDRLFPDTRFDVIVCLETIEHLNAPDLFLRAIKSVAADDAVIIITCPNDHWYYATDDQSNPFHVRKYSFEAFRELTAAVLGNASAWGYGGPVIGFGAVTDELVAGHDPLAGQTAMLDFRTQAAAIMLPPRGFSNIGPRNCSYFIGVWGGDAARLYTSAVVPVSMDQYANLVSWEAVQLSPRRIGELESERSALLGDKLLLEQKSEQARTEIVELHGRAEAAEHDLALARGELEQAQKDHEAGLAAIRADHEVILAAVETARDHYRIQAFALNKEVDLISAQLRKIAAERDAVSAELGAARSTAALAADEYVAEIDALELQLNTLTAEQERLRALLRSQEGLRYLTKAMPKALARRVAFTLRPVVVRPARAAKPYLPAPLLSAVRRIARALRLQ
ncbi:MAG: methyltransferase domain-containing protein [Alphaproteobacteria bacterium]|nr:MAG: methyltransferase domain-containing protein [Alphaproteobacteria bacterium]